MPIHLPPPIDQNGPLSQWVRVGTTNIVIPTPVDHSPTGSSVPLAAPTQNLWLKHFIWRGKRQGERVSETDGAAAIAKQQQTNLPHHYHNTSGLATPKRFLTIYHAMYLLGNEMAWKGLVDVLTVHPNKATKPQLTMLGPLQSKSNALSNSLATKVCERDEEG